MKYCEAERGRIFIIRLEDKEVLHEKIEGFAREKSITAATLIIIGGADKGSVLIVGPEKGRAAHLNPMEHVLDDVHEIVGTGTIFPNKDGNPILHMHIACGRNKTSVTGCVRSGVKVWHIMEVVLFELVEVKARRLYDPKTGFELLEPSGEIE